MGWVNIRIALANLLPGLFPTLFLMFFFMPNSQRILDISYITSNINISNITIFFICSVIIGIIIDLLRPKVEKIYIKYLNISSIVFIIIKVFSAFTKHKVKFLTLKQKFDYYDRKEKEVIKLWMSIQLFKHKDYIHNWIKENDILKKEFYNPTITSGDRWALINIIEKDSLEFLMQEYFSFYQFSFNLMVSIVISLVILFFLSIFRKIKFVYYIFIIIFIFLILLDNLTEFWLLSTKRFVRKLIIFSLLK